MSAFGLGCSGAGTPNTGVTAVEYGDGRSHTSILTVSQTDALTVADNAALADGYLLYTFPAGAFAVNSAMMSIEVNHADGESAAGAGELALGTTASSGANATIGASATTDENICGPLAGVNTTDAAVNTVLYSQLVIATGGAHTVYLNIADTWANVTGTDLDADIVGTVVLSWTTLA